MIVNGIPSGNYSRSYIHGNNGPFIDDLLPKTGDVNTASHPLDI